MVGVSGLTDNERFLLTAAGYEELKRELEALEGKRQEELDDYADVNYSSDPSKEEAAYYETRVTKEHTDERIQYLQTVLNHAEIIGEDPNPETVDPGDRVTVWDFSERTTLQLDIVGVAEVVEGGRGISVESPVGKALLGKRIGDVIEVAIPDGTARYAVRKIERIPGV